MSNVKIYPYDLWKKFAVNFTSQHPNFPASNTQDRWPQKPWRSRYGALTGFGNFDISASNNQLSFRERADLLTVDPELEIWTNPTTLTNWTCYKDPGFSLDREAVEIHEGTYSLKLTAGVGLANYCFISQNITIGAGNHRISIWYKNAVAGKQLQIYLYDTAFNQSLIAGGTWQAGIHFIVLPNSLTWTKYEVDFVKHVSYSNYTLSVLCSQAYHVSASAYVDEFFCGPYPKNTVSITPGFYNTDTLADEIETQMEASGAYDYEVTYDDVLHKFVIETSNGTDLFQLLYEETTNAIWTELGFTGVYDSLFDTSFTSDVVRIHTYEQIDIDCLTQQEVYAIFLLGVNFTTASYVKIQCSNDNFATIPIDSTITLATAGERMAIIFTSPILYRYFRVYIYDPGNSDGYVQIGRVFLAYKGQDTTALSIVEPKRGYGPKGAGKVQDFSLIDSSDGGQRSSIVRYKDKSKTLDFDMIDNKSAWDLMTDDLGVTIPAIVLYKPFTGNYLYNFPENNFVYARLGNPQWKRLSGLLWELKIDVNEEK